MQIVDAQGRVVPSANELVKFALSGPGAIIGLNNGNPNCHEPEKGGQHSVFHGLAQVILQSGFASRGKLTLRATSEGLTPAEVTVKVTSAPARPAVPVAYPTSVIGNWRMSPFSTEHPDPNQKIADTDMNSSGHIQPGHGLPTFKDGRFAIYRAQFTPRSGVQKSGGELKLRDISGKAEVWIDGKLAAEKTDASKQNVTVPFPPGNGVRTVSVLIEAPTTGAQAGLGGTVTIESAGGK